MGVKITALTELTTPTSDDLLEIVDDPAGTPVSKKITWGSLMANAGAVTATSVTVNGGASNTLVVNGTSASGQLTVNAKDASTVGLVVNTAASPTVDAIQIRYNGTTAISFLGSGNRYNVIDCLAFDNGSSVGPMVVIRQNNNATTPSAGVLIIQNKNGVNYRIWPDGSGLLRIWTSNPTYANDTAGTVVGDQTSYLAAKTDLRQITDLRQSLEHIKQAAKRALYGFRYKDGQYNGQYFDNGIVIDYAPRYGKDRDKDHPHGKSLNEVTAIADLFAAVAVLDERLTKLEAKNG